MSETTWNNLIIDTAATPLPLGPDRFRQWMEGQRVFISSVMDPELDPYRDAGRAYLRKEGATAVMWEELTPEDKEPTRAFLDGVDQSTLFCLILGNRYGVSDASGYSPTHKEANRAKELPRPRLLFILPDQSRDGRLNDWLRSLYSELSGVAVASREAFVQQLDNRLRELAARAERNWIKLGRFIFPGKVSSKANAREGYRFSVTARASSNSVRNGLAMLAQTRIANQMRLTWPNRSATVEVDAVTMDSEFAGDEEVRIECHAVDRSYESSGAALGLMQVGGANPKSPRELASIWARRSILGEPFEVKDRFDLANSMTAPDAPTLPDVLSATRATGWVAEGLSRLYAVEEVARRQCGQFSRLEVGPSTAASIRIYGAYEVAASVFGSPYTVALEGRVSLRP